MYTGGTRTALLIVRKLSNTSMAHGREYLRRILANSLFYYCTPEMKKKLYICSLLHIQ